MFITIGQNTRKNMEILKIKDYPFTEETLKYNYRSIVKTCHPDLFPENKELENLFKKVSQAYESLQYLAKTVSLEEKEVELRKQEQDKDDIFAVYDTCTKCNGQGTVIEKRVSYYEEIINGCSYCSSKCIACDGTGKFIQRNKKEVTCRVCNGSGVFHKKYCFICFGLGKIQRPIYKNEKVLCSKCNGTGKIKLNLFNPVIPKGAIL